VALYGRHPAEFTAARGELVRHLRAAGEREREAGVAALRRPTVSAWALGQVARNAPDLITGLLRSGVALRDAVARAMGGDASSLRAAEAAERAAVDAVVAKAATEGRAARVPLNDAHRRRIAATLRAAVLDDKVAAALLAGTLDRDHEAAPLGFDAGAAVPSIARPAPRPREHVTAEARARRAELDRLRKDADRLARRAERLQGEAEEAGRRVAELRARAKDAAQAAREARRQVAAVERRSDRGRG